MTMAIWSLARQVVDFTIHSNSSYYPYIFKMLRDALAVEASYRSNGRLHLSTFFQTFGERQFVSSRLSSYSKWAYQFSLGFFTFLDFALSTRKLVYFTRCFPLACHYSWNEQKYFYIGWRSDYLGKELKIGNQLSYSFAAATSWYTLYQGSLKR